MGYNMGLGMAAAAIDADRIRRMDEYQQALRDADMATKPEQIESRRSDLRTNIAENQGLDAVRPSRTAAHIAGNNLSAAQYGATKEILDATQPYTVRQRKAEAAVGAGKAEAGVDNLTNTVLDLRGRGILDANRTQELLLGGLYEKVRTGDTEGAARYATDVLQRAGSMPGAQNKIDPRLAFTGIEPDEKVDPTGMQKVKGFSLVANNGQRVFIPQTVAEDAYGVYQSAIRPKGDSYQVGHTTDGTIYQWNKGTGKTSIVQQGNPSKMEHAGPTERDVKYLVREHGMDRAGALELLTTAKRKGRAGFVEQYVQQNSRGVNQDHAPLITKANQIYDDIYKSSGNAPATPSQSGTDWRSWGQ